MHDNTLIRARVNKVGSLFKYFVKVVLMDSALLWYFATRHSLQAMALVLVKSCNAVAEYHSNARRVGLSAPMTVLRLLQRTKGHLLQGVPCHEH
ncbi:MAG: hypothetical protein GY807_05205 [Gammaproteobacteria bacterium]|nr:hypothetical protein [Gammaproteobacteria bacterium]